MSEREMLRNLNLGRVLVGIAALLLPGVTGRTMIGPVARGRWVKALVRMFGVRDLALGIATLDALDEGRDTDRLVQLGMAADAVDTFAFITAGSDVPLHKRLFTVVVAGSAVAVGARALSEPVSSPLPRGHSAT